MMTVIGTPSSHSMIGIVSLLIIKCVIEKTFPSRIPEMREAPSRHSTGPLDGSSC